MKNKSQTQDKLLWLSIWLRQQRSDFMVIEGIVSDGGEISEAMTTIIALLDKAVDPNVSLVQFFDLLQTTELTAFIGMAEREFQIALDSGMIALSGEEN